MRKEEREAIGKLFESVTRVDDPERCHQNMLVALTELSGAENGQFIHFQRTVMGRQFAERVWGTPHYVEAYPKASPYYVWKNPVWPHIQRMRHVVENVPALVGEREYFNSEYYVDLLDKVGVRNFVAYRLKNRQGQMAWALALGRDRRSKYFSKRTIELLTHIAPYLGRGLDNIESWHDRWQRGQSALALVEAVREPVVALRHQRLAAASPAAARILGLDEGPADRNLALEEFLRLAPQACGPGGGTVVWTARDGRRYALSALKAPPGAEDGALIVRLDALAPTPPDPARVVRAAMDKGLTEREARVFAALARGLSTKQIALDQGIAYDTARAHLRNIYRKLHANGRVEAINAVRQD
ncbi:MAG: hypothetical protein KIS92_02830 [Planctomycetota bacterium]|nr:hypothetical protein [Planctomycetota bacterium]